MSLLQQVWCSSFSLLFLSIWILHWGFIFQVINTISQQTEGYGHSVHFVLVEYVTPSSIEWPDTECSAGTELIFFVRVHTMLCLGFLMKTVVFTHWCYFRAVLWQRQWLFCFSCCLTSKEAGDAQRAGRGQSQDTWPKWTKGMSRTMCCHGQQ